MEFIFPYFNTFKGSIDGIRDGLNIDYEK